jgi:hypothetical protein
VRRVHVLGAVAANRVGPQVVTQDEEDVWPDGRRCGTKRRGEEQGADGRECSEGFIIPGQSIDRIAAYRSILPQLSAENRFGRKTPLPP